MIVDMKEARTVADISASAASMENFDAPFNGYLDVSGCYLEWFEAPGAQSGTQGVISLEVNGNEVATVDCAQSGAVGDVQLFTVDGTYATTANPHVAITAGQVIDIKVKTQAVTDPVGEAIVHLALSWGA